MARIVNLDLAEVRGDEEIKVTPLDTIGGAAVTISVDTIGNLTLYGNPGDARHSTGVRSALALTALELLFERALEAVREARDEIKEDEVLTEAGDDGLDDAYRFLHQV